MFPPADTSAIRHSFCKITNFQQNSKHFPVQKFIPNEASRRLKLSFFVKSAVITAEIYTFANLNRFCMATMPDMTKRKSITSDSTSIRHPLLAGFLAFVAYYIVFQAFYNKIAEGEFYPYTDLYDFLLYGTLNFIPIFIIFVADVSIVFKLNRLKDITTNMPSRRSGSTASTICSSRSRAMTLKRPY